MKKDYVILRHTKKNYFFPYIKGKNIYSIYKYNDINKVGKMIGKKGYKIFSNWKYKVKKYNNYIIFDTGYTGEVGKYIKEKNKNARIIIYFWNSISDNNKWIFEDGYVDDFYTFDKNDSVKYNINYNPNFYTSNIKKINKKCKYDVLFLGRDKNRKDIIIKTKNIMDNLNIKSKIILIENEKDYISYKKYLKLIYKSKCIIEILAKDQAGMTLRTLESLFLSKKLVTNNNEIEKYDFYNKQNIFILGKDKTDNLYDFINSDYVEIDKKIIAKYDFDSWLNNFKL